MTSVVEPSPCDGCRGPCCSGRLVMVSAPELVTLARALGLSWHDLATVGVAFSDGFRLDAGPARWGFRLREKPGGACTLVLELDGWARCGAHALRPAACRLYPYHVALDDDGWAVGLGSNAACPPPPAQLWRLRAAADEPLVDDAIAERALYLRALARWDAAVARAPEPLDADAFVGWIARLYDALAPLRRDARAAWQPAAYALVDGFAAP